MRIMKLVKYGLVIQYFEVGLGDRIGATSVAVPYTVNNLLFIGPVNKFRFKPMDEVFELSLI